MMKKILKIFESLSNKEIDLIRKYFQKNIKCQQSKLLFEKIYKTNIGDDNLISKELYNSSPNSSYSHLKRRLKEKIVDIIYNSKLTEHTNNSAQSAKAQCVRFLTKSSLLIEKGLKNEADHYLDLANEIIIERQFIFEKLKFYFLKLEVNDCPKAIESITIRLNEAIKELSDTSISKIKFHKKRTRRSNTTDVSYKQDNVKSNSTALGSYYDLMGRIYSCLELLQIDRALLYSNSLVELIQKSSKCFSQSEIIKAQLTHLRGLIFSKNLKSAILFCTQIDILKTTNQDLKLEFLILKFLIAYYLKDFTKARYYLEKLKFSSNTWDAKKPLFFYLNMCLLFQQRKFQEIMNFFYNNNCLQGVKDNFSLAVKALEIYCLLELDKNELAYSKLLAFKQYLKRNDSFSKTRYQFIIKVLLNLIKNDFQYDLTQKFYTKQSIKSFKDDIRFKPDFQHYELITLEEWLFMKGVEVNNLQLKAVIS